MTKSPSLTNAINDSINEEHTTQLMYSLEVAQDGGDMYKYTHPLALIEYEEKIYREWEIREIPVLPEEGKCVEVPCDSHPASVKEYIAICRETCHTDASAFVWPLKDGPLVTFYNQSLDAGHQTAKILKRYIINWKTYPSVQE